MADPAKRRATYEYVLAAPEHMFEGKRRTKAFVEAVEEGLADVEAGRVHSHESVQERLAARRRDPDR